MMDPVQHLIARYATKGALLDTGLFLLLITGSIDPAHIQRNKRTRIYTITDFQILCRLLRHFTRIFTTPNVATEVSNLTNTGLSGKLRQEAYRQLASHIRLLNEEFIASADASGRDEFFEFGLTDSAIIQLSLRGILPITDDLRLAAWMTGRRLDVINFTHLRQYLINT